MVFVRHSASISKLEWFEQLWQMQYHAKIFGKNWKCFEGAGLGLLMQSVSLFKAIWLGLTPYILCNWMGWRQVSCWMNEPSKYGILLKRLWSIA